MMDPAEFRRILHNGLGRAILYLRDHDATPHREAIHYACLHDTVYDRQVNGSNAEYIYEVIGLTGEPHYYRDALLMALRHPAEGYHLGQICDLLRCFAQRGETQARDALYFAFDQDEIGAYEAMFALVELDGVPAFLRVAESLGREVEEDEEFWEGTRFLSQLSERFGGETVRDSVAEACAKSPNIAAYIAAIEREQSKREPAKRIRFDPKTMGYSELKEYVAGKGRWSPVSLRLWGDQASADDVTKLAYDVLAETDPVRLHAYLRVFAERPFPLGHKPLFQFVDSLDHRVLHAAIGALSNFRHPEVRALALALLPTPRCGAALALLASNYQEDDYRLIEAALLQPGQQSEEEWHRTEIGVHELFDQFPSVAATGSLMILYERGRCSLCRHGTVKMLDQLGALPETIRRECEYDADFGLRAAARRRFREEGEASVP